MKLKVVACSKQVWIEAETIDILKAKIMDGFYLTAGELSRQRLLVRDNRNRIFHNPLLTGCVDLLQLEDGSSLDGGGLCNDGDTLVLGWKGYYNVRLVTDFVDKKGRTMKLDDSSTLGQLKRKIKRATGKRLTPKNLPEVLFNEGDDEKPLLYFGFYRMFPFNPDFEDAIDFKIHPHKDNRPVSKHHITCMVRVDDDGNSFPTYFGDDAFSFRSEEAYKEVKEKIENRKRKIQSKEENIENPKKKKSNNKGMEGDKEEASCSNVVGKES